MFFLFIALRIVLCLECVPNDLLIGYVFCHHAIDFTPIGQSANISVVDKKVGLELSGEVIVLFLFLSLISIFRVSIAKGISSPICG